MAVFRLHITRLAPVTLLLSLPLEYVSSYGTRGCHSFRCPLKKAWAPGIPLARLLSLCLQYRHSAWVWSHGTEACMFVCAARVVEFAEWLLVILFWVMDGHSSRSLGFEGRMLRSKGRGRRVLCPTCTRVNAAALVLVSYIHSCMYAHRYLLSSYPRQLPCPRALYISSP
jgi:hypothetical protein